MRRVASGLSAALPAPRPGLFQAVELTIHFQDVT